MKKFLGTFLFTTLFIFATPFMVNAESSNEVMSESEIKNEVMKIADKYEIGEELSKEDQKFIEKHLGEDKSTKPSLMATKSFDETKYNSAGTVGVWATGQVSHDIQNAINQSYSADFNAYGVGSNSSSISEIEVEVRHTAFGLAGSGGVLKVYDDGASKTCNTGSCQLNTKKNYSAVVAYASTQAIAKVHYPGGLVELAK